MKFGDSLLQRSVPQWRSYNLDYGSIKQLIKDNTTPGRGKAIPIPGQIATVAEDFEKHLFQVIGSQHDRVSLFVKSKRYEVDGRLSSIERQLVQLRRRGAGASSQVLASQTRRKLSRIEFDLLAVGEEIQNLSRFISINRLAIRKLLKKYRKWTGVTNLGEQPALEQYSIYLDTVRSPFDQQLQYEAGRTQRHRPGESDSEHRSQTQTLIASARSPLAFDDALAAPSSGPEEETAVYWVHADNAVQLRILLLQHLRYAKVISHSDGEESPASPNSGDPGVSGDDKVGVIVLGDVTRLQEQPWDLNNKTNDVMAGIAGVAATVRWCGTDVATISVSHAVEPDSDGPTAKISQEHVASFLDLSSSYSPDSLELDGQLDDALGKSSEDQEAVRTWLREHGDIEPVACVRQIRSRFVGLENASDQGVHAALDEEIYMADTSLKRLKASHFSNGAWTQGLRFPHAVLLVRAEGNNKTLLRVLDQSHLTERVPDFSTELHALAVCNKSDGIPKPPWFYDLEKDIRHIPPPETSTTLALSRRTSSSFGLASAPPTRRTSRSATSNTPTSLTVNDVVAPQYARTKSKLQQTVPEEQQQPGQAQQPSYWNEYDFGSEAGGDQAFVIYVDPNTPVFPGQEALNRWAGNLKTLFRRSKKRPGRDPDLERQLFDASANTSSDGLALSTESSDDEMDDHANDASRTALLGSRGGLRSLQTRRLPNTRSYGTVTKPFAVRAGTAAASQSPYSHISTICLAAAVMLLALTTVLATTGRRKLRGEVDTAVVVGVVAVLSFAVGGVANLMRVRVGWGGKVGAGLAFAGVCIWVGGLLGWLLW